ncbi:hypothetical protein BDV28DRAFT_127282 [Aspergillus coremiiformis]|uniref:Rhodopsin domain-containing protein n=1 Tax=Aspergillus coremiiformis TaxID=138285 RepID=A0A5N6ZH53_9EURO|nr:hypothetical protein BDV28DRAFT_127282 [Aspergillus coremiiformis]
MTADITTIETFTEYSIGMCFLLVRLYARVKHLGIRGLQLEDAFATLAMVFWTMLTPIIHVLGTIGANVGLNDQTAMQVPDNRIPTLVLGSKLTFLSWVWYIFYIWCLKGMLMCRYTKLTQGTFWHRPVHIASAFCLLTGLASILTHLCICTPIPRNWQIKPYAGDNCTIRKPNFLIITALNLITDLLILLIPIPVLLKLQIPLPRKLILTFLFSSGIFVMICTILRTYYSLNDLASLAIALGWANRECFVAAIVASLPGIKPLFGKSKWLGSWNRGRPVKNAPASLSQRLRGGNQTFVSAAVDRVELLDRRHEVGGCREVHPSGIQVTRELKVEHAVFVP